jgi:CPA1 family monovalent cation:H+ antiporter
MHAFELILGLMVVVIGLAALADRLDVPYPILLVLGGLALAFVPGLPHVELEPEIVFLLFLPPILFSAAYFTSWRDFRANGRAIGLLAVGLVLFTTVAVAVVARWAVPGLGWPEAFVLGAIVSPPDAVATTAITGRLGVPRRVVTVLEGESLVNDATALVALRFATAAVVTGAFSPWRALGEFVLVALGGIALGLAVGWLIAWLLPHLEDPEVAIGATLLAPIAAYLPAEELGVSGVLAAVVAGLFLGRRSSGVLRAYGRLEGRAV